MRRRTTLGGLIREPLMHFLLLGMAFFVLYGAVSPGDTDSRRITVTQAQVDSLARQYQAVWGRPATPTELRALVDAQVRDEVLYRAGMAAGLGRDDAVIKRRIRQKLEVIAEEEDGSAPPTDAQLAAYLKAHPDQFAGPATVSFEQLYFDPAAPGAAASVAAAKMALAHGEAVVGGSAPLPRRVAGESVALVARDFGSDFADGLARLPRGRWVGPLASGVGAHLVKVEAWTPAAPPPLAAVRADVEREWLNDRRLRALEASYQRLRRDYDIVVEAKLPGTATK